jgi:3-oxoacyl-[acyl-carrier-protein] synthase II
MGVVSAIGHDLETFWDALVTGKSGVGLITQFDTSQSPVKIGAEVRNLDVSPFMEPHEQRKLDPNCVFAVAAAEMAIKDSEIDFEKTDRDNVGVIAASGIGGIQELEAQHTKLMERGPSRVSPLTIPKLMMNAMAGHISIRHGLRGPNFTTASACASSTHAMGLSLHTIAFGQADVMITGGTEASITPLGMAGFANMRALSTRNDDPTRASRPFDKRRDGFVMGEGAAFLVMEELEHARKRGARIYAEMLGYGCSGDGHHITAPDPSGGGACLSMHRALKDAGCAPDDVNYVNAHGTSTPLNDATETCALKTVFQGHARKLAISSTKSMVGHLLGASGALELVATSLSVAKGVVHSTINQEESDPDCDLDYVPNQARDLRIERAISNSFGFGGHNATLVLGRHAG